MLIKNNSKAPCEAILFREGRNGDVKERRRWLPGESKDMTSDEMEAIYRSSEAGKALIETGILTGWGPREGSIKAREARERAAKAEHDRRVAEAKKQADADREKLASRKSAQDAANEAKASEASRKPASDESEKEAPPQGEKGQDKSK